MSVKTMGQAVDAAIKRHEREFPESEVYLVSVSPSEKRTNAYRVEIRASHFSVPFVYNILEG
jgi:hypothetical protein